MRTRPFGNTGIPVSEIGLGCWQLGGTDWGRLEDRTALNILSAAVDAGVDFLDTADVYGNGRSESLIGRFLKTRGGKILVATKLGRTADLYPNGYTEAGVRRATEASLARLGVERLDLTQLHCVPPAVLERGEVFDWLRKLRGEGKIRWFGASVESVEEALVCLRQKDLASLQVIFNVFRQRPARELFSVTRERGTAVIVRLPLASGLLSGTMSTKSRFASQDHRTYNRDGDSFNVGETFAGLPFEKGVELAQDLKAFVPEGVPMAQWSLRWILDHDAVSVIIPGASRPSQARENTFASGFPPLSPEVHRRLGEFYLKEVKPFIRGAE